MEKFVLLYLLIFFITALIVGIIIALLYGFSQKGEGRTIKEFIIKNKSKSELNEIILNFFKENQFKIEKVNDNKYIGKIGSVWGFKAICFEIALSKMNNELKFHGEFYIPQLPPIYELDLNPNLYFGSYSRKPAIKLMNKLIQAIEN
jgi:hypothetical protein